MAWSTAWGDGGNARRSVAESPGLGVLLWSVELPGVSQSLILGDGGRCFAGCAGELIAIDPGGSVAWRAPAGARVTPLLATAGGRLLSREGQELVAREQATGRRVASRPVGAHGVPARLGADVVLVEMDDDLRTWLRLRDPDGRPRWSRELEQRSSHAPLVRGDVIIVGDDGQLKAFGRDGSPLWCATRSGFRAKPVRRSGERQEREAVLSPIVQLDPQRVVAAMEWWDGQAHCVFDLERQIVTKLVPDDLPLAMHAPLATAIHPDRGPCIVTRSAPVPAKPAGWHARTVMVDLAGSVVWETRDPLQPLSIVTDAKAQTFISVTVAPSEWEGQQSLGAGARSCYLRGIAPDGNELYVWVAPGPLAPAMAVGAAGEIYLQSAGRLWAIG